MDAIIRQIESLKGSMVIDPKTLVDQEVGDNKSAIIRQGILEQGLDMKKISELQLAQSYRKVNEIEELYGSIPMEPQTQEILESLKKELEILKNGALEEKSLDQIQKKNANLLSISQNIEQKNKKEELVQPSDLDESRLNDGDKGEIISENDKRFIIDLETVDLQQRSISEFKANTKRRIFKWSLTIGLFLFVLAILMFLLK